MFYRNNNLKKKTTKVKLNFTNFASLMDTQDDDALMPLRRAKMSYNFNVKRGSLKNGNGFEELSLPSLSDQTIDRTIIPPNGVIKKIWHFKYYF